MIRTLRLAASLAAAGFMVVSTSAQTPRTAEPVPGLDASGMDRSARPQDDFFRFVNGGWTDRVAIPAEQPSYGTFAILRDKAMEDVRNILEEAGAHQASRGSIEQKIGDFYKSFLDAPRIESLVCRVAGRALTVDQ